MKASFYTDENEVQWENLVRASHRATFQHTRKFLGYHKDRFHDRSVIVEEDGKLIALLPAVAHPNDFRILVSHAGATYGGLIVDNTIYGEGLIALIELIKKFLNKEGFRKLIYKSTPSIYHVSQDEDDLYALFRTGAILERVDINTVLDTNNRLKISNLRKRSYKKAQKSDLNIDRNFSNLQAFHSVLVKNLSDKHDAIPVHSVSELEYLKDIFGEVLELVVAKNSAGEVVAGVLFFRINKVCHAQYIASSSSGYASGALDYIFEDQISNNLGSLIAFGTSNENDGKVLNQTLYRFKRQFGSGSVVHFTYTLDL
ncbi:hypothetical protein JCM19238_3251 [Vibrio ponticus]|nr:hypothetical protein JCM19238_3251 [Vibrio ponticus]